MLPTIKRYGEHLNSQDILKFIAIVLMIVDHIGQFYFTDDLWFRVIGRMCIPIWFFFIGHSKSQRVDKQIIGSAILFELFDVVCHSPVFPMNILVTIIFCRLFHRYFLNKYLTSQNFDLYAAMAICIVCVILYVPTTLLFNYGTLALLFSSLGYLIQQGRRDFISAIFAGVAVISFSVPQIVTFNFTITQSIVLIGGIALITAVLYHYSLYYFRITWHQPAGFIVMLFGRNTLYFYLGHLMVLIMIDKYLHPGNYLAFSWTKMW